MSRCLVGRRVRVVKCDDPYYEKPIVGEEGVVEHVDDIKSVHIQLDDGRHISLLYKEDAYEIV